MITYLTNKVDSQTVAHLIGGRLIGKNLPIYGVSTYSANIIHSISYQVGAPSVVLGQARTVICTATNLNSISGQAKIIVEDAREAFMRLLYLVSVDWWKTVAVQAEILGLQQGEYEVHHTALIEDGVYIGRGACIEPHAVVRSGSIIGNDCLVASGSIIGASGPSIYQTRLGDRLSWSKIHFGTVAIGSRSEVGTSCVILRAMLGGTRVGEDTILGNMVHIGHGAQVGKGVWMAARVTVCGHCLVSDGVKIGAGAVLRDNISVGSGASIAMGSVVVTDVGQHQAVMGVPAKVKYSPSGDRL